MQLVPVKLYGLFGKFRPVEYEIDEEMSQMLDKDSLLDVDNHCYEICRLFKSGPQIFINLRLLPNPQLYEPRPRLTFPPSSAN